MIYPSQFACEAAGQPASVGTPAHAGGACAFCARPHQVGEPVVDFQPGNTFTDWAALKAPGSRYLCVWCDAVRSRDFTQTYLKTVITREGVFPAASNDHLAYWHLNPPEGPWLFLQGDQKIQHVVWRAVVNTSTDVYLVRAGDTCLTIRRGHVELGAHAAKALAATATELRQAKRGAPLKSPFVSLSRDMDSPSQGFLRRELIEHGRTHAQTAQQIKVINSLTAGELWALTSVLYAKSPSKPQTILTRSAA